MSPRKKLRILTCGLLILFAPALHSESTTPTTSTTSIASDTSVALVPANQTVPRKTGPELFKLARSTVFRLNTQGPGAVSSQSHGTAFAVSSFSLVTNYHVVAEALGSSKGYKLFLSLPNTREEAHVVAIDPINDLAIIAIKKHLSVYLNTSPAKLPELGESIFSLGFPFGENLTITQGTYNGEQAKGLGMVTSISMAINPGMSGGPTLNDRGEVIGVNRAHLIKAQNVSFLSPLSAIQKLTANWGEIVKASFSDQIFTSRLSALPNAELNDGRDLWSFRFMSIEDERRLNSILSAFRANWRSQIVKDVVAQENLHLYTRNLASLENPSLRPRVGQYSFQAALPGQVCSQNSEKSDVEKKKEYYGCSMRSFALVDLSSDTLEINTSAFHQTSISMLDGPTLYDIDKLRRDLKNIQQKKILNDRFPTQAIIGKPPRLKEKCSAYPMKNRNLVQMDVRYCSVEIVGFDKIFSTYLKIQILGSSGITSFTQTYEGMSLPTTGRLITSFIESIRKESAP